MLKKVLMVGATILALMGMTACTQTEKSAATGAAIGAGTGAVIGGVASGSASGALVGAAAGGVAGGIAGTLVGQVAGEPEQCYYRDSDGDLFIDECPAG